MRELTSLRLATAADAACIGVLGAQVFLATYASDGVRPALAREVLRLFAPDAIAALLGSPATAFILAEREGHLVGFAQLTHGARHPLVSFEPSCELDRVYVLDRFASRGIGKMLMMQAEQAAAARGARAMWLTAWIGNDRALGFYRRLGYTDRGRATYSFEGEDFENRVFAKQLARG